MDEEQSPTTNPGLLATADRDVWPSGALITGVLDVTNTAPSERLLFSTGDPAVGTLSTLDGMPVGNDSRPHRGVGRHIDLAPGATTRIAFVCSSSNIDPSHGTTVPPGDYLLAVRLRVATDHAKQQLTAPPLRIRLERPCPSTPAAATSPPPV